jgi:hypothetical protein
MISISNVAESEPVIKFYVGFEVLLAVDFRKVAEYALVVELF